MKRLSKSALLILILIMPSNYFVFGQEEPQPPGQDAGPQAERFKSEVEEAEKRFEERKAKPAEIEIKEEEEKPAPEGASFILKEIKITGMTLYREEDFRPAYEAYLDKEITFKDLEDIAEKIKLKYKEKGYLTTTAYIPEQDIKDGVVQIRIAEGKVGALTVEGSKWFPSTLLKKYFHIKKNEVMNVQKLERDLLRINKNPDLEVKAVISPGTEPETSDLILNVKDHRPYHIGFNTDNKGSRLVGKERGMLTIRSTNATANNDSLFLSFLYAKHSNAQSISYLFPVDTYGTRMGVTYSHFNLRLGKDLKDSRITGDTKVVTPYVIKELYLSQNFEAELNVGMDIKSIKKHTDGVTSSDDQLRIPYVTIDFTKSDEWGQTVFSPRLDFGTSDFLGASSKDHPTSSRRVTGGYFWKYGHGMTRTQRMFFESYAVIHSDLQATFQTLSPSEQMQLGGAASIRGYPEGDFLADTGVVVNIDWIFPTYIFPESFKLPHSDVALRRQIEPVLFVDVGGGRLNKALAGERRDKFLASVGGGLRVRLYKNLFARFEWAKDIGSAPAGGSGVSTFHFSIQSEI